MRKIKVVLFIDGLRAGGKERQIVEIIKGFHSSDILFELVLMNKNIHYQEIFDYNIKVHYLIRKTKKDISVFYKFHKLCKLLKPDLIHTWDTMTSLISIPTAKIQKIILLNGSLRNAMKHRNYINNLLKSIALKLSDNILSNSFAGLRVYKIPKNKGYCIHNGFDLNRLNQLILPDIIKNKLGVSSNDKIVGMVGAFTEKKDYISYINVAVNVLNKRNDVTFLLIGHGRTIDECKRLIPYKFLEKIIFTGRQNQIESIVNIFDIGVLLTNQKVHEEGISNSIMEYMVCAKPVIATDGGGTDELIENNRTGFLFKNNSIENISDKIQFLIDNEDIAIKIGEEAKQQMLKEFTLEKMIKSYFNLYCNLTKVQYD